MLTRKPILSYLIAGERDGMTALDFMGDLRKRIDGRTQLSTDGLGAYLGLLRALPVATWTNAQIIKECARRGCGDVREWTK